MFVAMPILIKVLVFTQESLLFKRQMFRSYSPTLALFTLAMQMGGKREKRERGKKREGDVSAKGGRRGRDGS